ncbi:LuxR family transcriptional regulator [Pseudomonas sp. 14P_8.1_Bac3]|uniref:LuxR family transcriptional regulator n=1 Tax=Pseudomonas sp. 14P_8.1_Bac3 TaxID=2971621 RepID=UPI0021C990A8|nr:LuxR family transcriptional regulator [Pseudomonas sp. 14P_8.1_Bac3]MCU1759412.1 LuxR family transcriptional regulator [Pseudomonas sp. 14P_8.1_Bac3]
MERWKESQLTQLSCTTDIDTAYRVALSFAKNIGFKFVAFSTTYQTKNTPAKTVTRNNFPIGWNSEYQKKNFGPIDPVVAHCNQSMLPVLWNEQLFANVPSLWHELESRGLQHGWSQALHDEESGLCSILSLARSHCPITPMELYENLGFSVFMGRHLHELALQSLPRKPLISTAAHLSPREVDVLELAAAGKTADESARILNLSARTIHFHMQSAMGKLGAANKISAIIAAIKAGYLNSSSIPNR